MKRTTESNECEMRVPRFVMSWKLDGLEVAAREMPFCLVIAAVP